MINCVLQFIWNIYNVQVKTVDTSTCKRPQKVNTKCGKVNYCRESKSKGVESMIFQNQNMAMYEEWKNVPKRLCLVSVVRLQFPKLLTICRCSSGSCVAEMKKVNWLRIYSNCIFKTTGICLTITSSLRQLIRPLLKTLKSCVNYLNIMKDLIIY